MKTLFLVLFLLIAATAAGAADLGGSTWYVLSGGEVYELRLGDCGFSPCEQDTGEHTEAYYPDGGYISDLGPWRLAGRIFSIAGIYTGVISQDLMTIFGQIHILIRK